MTIKTSNLGFPRLGEKREWKKSIEGYWGVQLNLSELHEALKEIKSHNETLQQEYSLDSLPSGDFSYYDHVLDTSLLFNIIPARFQGEGASEDVLYNIARGNKDHVASALLKWFNTNYHYIVPEWDSVSPQFNQEAFNRQYTETAGNIHPVIVGPITYVALSKGGTQSFEEKVRSLLPLYKRFFEQFDDVDYFQVDEPILVTDHADALKDITKEAYNDLNQNLTDEKIVIQTYFERADVEFLSSLPVFGLGLDFVHDRNENLKQVQSGKLQNKALFAGVIDGRNVWRSDLKAVTTTVEELLKYVDDLTIQPSSSLLHVPVTLKNESLDAAIEDGLSFATEKLEELEALKTHFNSEDSTKLEALQEKFVNFNKQSFKHLEYDFNVPTERYSTFDIRSQAQQNRLNLPLLPTTTIGSFPQSKEVRKYRADWKNNRISDDEYRTFIQNETKRWVDIQEDLGLDVLVHGEFERNDMVEFFGERLSGFLVTKFGWVQSYGTRAVKPPIIYGDVKWTSPMTLEETLYAQSQTEKPVKGMLTGPVTILNWSFERVDIPKVKVMDQIALAIRDEVQSLEEAGISIIQVDEPALREGLPLRSEYHEKYLDEAVNAFKISTSSVKDDTQVHTHMCYSQFGKIIHAIKALDADVISIETSRSHGDLIKDFEDITYDLGIGLGVYDIHSPRIPKPNEIEEAIDRALKNIDSKLFWVNPDCGLKTRKEEEVTAALKILVDTVKEKRQALSQ